MGKTKLLFEVADKIVRLTYFDENDNLPDYIKKEDGYLAALVDSNNVHYGWVIYIKASITKKEGIWIIAHELVHLLAEMLKDKDIDYGKKEEDCANKIADSVIRLFKKNGILNE